MDHTLKYVDILVLPFIGYLIGFVGQLCLLAGFQIAPLLHGKYHHGLLPAPFVCFLPHTCPDAIMLLMVHVLLVFDILVTLVFIPDNNDLSINSRVEEVRHVYEL